MSDDIRPTLVDLFCAAGGTTRGFSFRPGVFPAFRPVLAIDKDEWGLRSYRENFPEARTVRTDLASLDDRSAWSLARECGLRTGELDCLVASPPCETFSSNTKWRADPKDHRNFLFRAVLRWVQVLRPKTVLVENVPGFRTMGNGLFHAELLERLTEWGYAVEWAEINAAEHRVPQMRRRLFYLAYRDDVGKPEMPKVSGHPHVTSRQAIGDLPPRVNGGGPDSFVSRIVPARDHRLGAFAAAMRPQVRGAVIRHHSAGSMSSTNIKRLRSMKPGQPMDSLPIRLQPKMGYRRAYGRLDAGQYGVTSRIRDRTGKQQPFDRTYDHLEDVETLVLVKAPPRRKVGTLIVHIPHRRGIKGSLSQALVERFRKEYSDFGLHLDTAVPAEVIQQTIDNGRVTKVRFVRRRPRTDEFERIGEYLDDPTEGSVEMVVNTSRLGALKKRNFDRVIKKEAELGSLLSFGGREYDTVKIEVDVGGKIRTIDVGAQSIGRVTWDVTEDLDYESGKPTRQSLIAQAVDLVDTIEQSTGAH